MKRIVSLALTLVLIIGTAYAADSDEFALVSDSTCFAENTYASTVQRLFTFSDRTMCWIRQYHFKESLESRYVSRFTMPGEPVSVYYSDGTVWREVSDLSKLPYATLYITTTKHTTVIGVPAVYSTDRDDTALTAVTPYDTSVSVRMVNDTTEITVNFPLAADTFGELWVAQSPEALIDLNDVRVSALTASYDLENKARWSLDGYYRKTNDSQDIYSPDTYFLSPIDYISAKLLINVGTDCLFARYMAYMMTKIELDNQNESGFFPTIPRSGWLLDEYDMKRGYYDTRFNSDFVKTLAYAYREYGDADFKDSAMRYFEFYFEFANSHGYSEGDGLLVPDYFEAGTTVQTHVALNHQLAEIETLLEWYINTNDDKLLDFAKRLLAGIHTTEEQWTTDGNLRYALHYDGTNALVDYPFLTYNDLFNVQKLLESISGERDEVLDRLMAVKKTWMDANGITDYYK